MTCDNMRVDHQPSFTNAGKPNIQQQPDLEARIGITLGSILRKEYGDTYNQDGRTIAEAKRLMQLRNPHIAHLTPEEALNALRLQLPKYLERELPFSRSKRVSESNREYWEQHLKDSHSDVLAVSVICSTQRTSLECQIEPGSQNFLRRSRLNGG
jgi:hypothetical protein